MYLRNPRRLVAALLCIGAVCASSGAIAQILPLHTGDINNDGFRNISDVNCYIASALTNAQNAPDPTCQAFSDDDIDLQCDGKIDVTDVQRSILITLYVLTGDSEIAALLQVKDADLDLLHNNCDPDDDNDTYPDVCENNFGTDQLDPLDFPTVPNACTCPNQCEIGGACIPNGTENPANSCLICDVAINAADWSPNDGAPCDDGDACTNADLCQAGGCVGTQPVTCDDGNQCTGDVCDQVLGCVNTDLDGTPCSDGDACTIADTCLAGVCQPLFNLDCDDSNLCTDDSCDPATGCVNAPNSEHCNDNNVCTLGDICTNGVCTPAGVLNCDDGNPCTTDSCDPIAGCQNIENTDPCNDGNACTN
ncbi:MAG: hypothetical protein HUU55_23845, partial [Myxococcales bacterium]|nr:hypothetical protein [Myxococcales bacterium]